MSSSSSNTKSKNGKNRNQHLYRITPRSFQELHPVHYQILDILKEDIPVTLIQTCRSLYDELTPKIYEKIEVNENTHDGITNIEADSGSEQEDDSEDEDDDRISSEADTATSTLLTPSLRNKALFHNRFINFTDVQGAIDFVKDCRYCHDWYCNTCSKNYTMQGQIFPNVEHIRLGGTLVCLLAELELESHPPFRDCWESHRSDEFLNLVSECMTPKNLCLDWPEDWSSGGWYYNPDDEEDEDDDWAVKRGMTELLFNISRTFHSVTHIVLHIDIEDFHLVTFDLEPTIASSMKFTFYISKEPKTKSAKVVQTLWNHFKSLKNHQWTFEYSVPYFKKYKNDLKDLWKEIRSRDLERFAAFKQRLAIEGEEYFFKRFDILGPMKSSARG
ncbi:uncharacterized protein L199_002418 [Kwoniella botswanensis]|uniref:uncharacterized protein n=1 Tax=Kwoniella botswanensis TaxID=1268659 RepID=UPI00315D547B